MPEQRYPKEVVVQRGDELFEQSIRAQVAGRPEMDFVAIDIESGDFEVGTDELAVMKQLLGTTARRSNLRTTSRVPMDTSDQIRRNGLIDQQGMKRDPLLRTHKHG